MFDPLCGCLRCLASNVLFKGSHSPLPNPLRSTRVPVFKHSDFVHRLIPKRSEINTPQTPQNLIFLEKLSLKTHSRSRPRKRCRPKGVKPLKITVVTHFQLLWKKPRASKNAPKWTPEWNLWALKITKIHYIQNSKPPSHKTALEGGPRRHFFR